jgi:hypothetical protein
VIVALSLVPKSMDTDTEIAGTGQSRPGLE